jgi:hypothetical protein
MSSVPWYAPHLQVTDDMVMEDLDFIQVEMLLFLHLKRRRRWLKC